MLKKIYTFALLFTIASCSTDHTLKCDLSSPKYLSIFQMDLSEEEIESLVQDADKLLDQEPYSVTSKKATPPSGDKHDYISMAPYLWPNPDTPDHLPYVPRDGEINPESRTDYTDQASLSNMGHSVHTLGLAYYYTQEPRYAAKANEFISVFFVEEQTRMNPNLKYGQFIPGRCEGRGIGIIETAVLSSMFEGIAFVEQSEQWSKATDEGMKHWAAEYLNWLQTHEYGIAESRTKNNHGTHYDAQVLGLYLYLDEIEAAKNYIIENSLPRIKSHAAKDGSQPQELRRTKSWNYTTMNLRGWVEIAVIANKIGVDLFTYGKEDGQIYLKSMIDWFTPYLKGEKAWTHQQIVTMKLDNIENIFSAAAFYYNDPKYIELVEGQQVVE